ncbi:MAG TPA: M20/M25/M40 family metallo-hydrolase [Planctomycetota bacterium]|nr:M20/M25/M40 family metallo-hydrolase [Planctomycetota bacterium]
MNRAPAALLLLVLPLSAQEPAAPSALDAASGRISVDRLKAHLTEISGDAYEGRNAGYPGNDKAAEYIAAHFKKIGLRPAGQKDDKGNPTWFQSFTVDKRPTRNVLGLAEGSDPDLKSEFVIIGAHHDHVGKEGESNTGRIPNFRADPGDKIWNGADDNGSGTVTVLEIAQAFMEGKIRTKRSVLFMTFSGEEWGLLGSKHYVGNPLLPLEKTVAMINLDMVGRNGTKPLDVMGVSTAGEWVDLCTEAAKESGVEIRTNGALIPGSDHYSFASKGIPAVHLFTGFHPDYHTKTDHAEKIDFDRMAKVARFGLRLLARVADRVPRMEFQTPRKLGIDEEDLDEKGAAALSLPAGQGGLKVLRVVENSVAARAGLKVGDVLLEFNGAKFPLENGHFTLRNELKKVKDGVDVPLLVLRDGKRVELKAAWEKKKNY